MITASKIHTVTEGAGTQPLRQLTRHVERET
jgi:hypothetical protein